MRETRTNWSLLWSVLSANLLTFAALIGYAFTSPVLPKLNGQIAGDNPLGRTITPFEESWIVSLLNLGAILGPILSCHLVDRIGRKKVLLLSSVPMIISFIIFYCSSTIELYYLSRFLLGLGCGCVYSIVPMYVGEISQDSNRGSFGCLLTVLGTTGLLYGYAIGPFVTIKLYCITCTIPLLVFFVAFAMFAQESPYYLMKIKEDRLAENALRQLRTNPDLIMKELEEIRANIDSVSYQKLSLRKVFWNRPMAIGVGLMFFQQFSGISVILCYMQSIFDAAATEIPSEISPIIIAIIQLLTNLIVTRLADRLGRKLLLITSSLGVVLANFLLGLFFHLKTNNYEIVNDLLWLPITSLILWTISFSSGLAPIAWAIISEIFPTNYKSIATTFTTVCCFVVGFVSTVFFPRLNLIIGIAKSFWLFAGISAFGTVFICLFVPETKGKTFQEIQNLLQNKK